jgi:hypothetical protein
VKDVPVDLAPALLTELDVDADLAPAHMRLGAPVDPAACKDLSSKRLGFFFFVHGVGRMKVCSTAKLGDLEQFLLNE